MAAYNKTPFSYTYHGGGYKLVIQYVIANLHEYIIFYELLILYTIDVAVNELYGLFLLR